MSICVCARMYIYMYIYIYTYQALIRQAAFRKLDLIEYSVLLMQVVAAAAAVAAGAAAAAGASAAATDSSAKPTWNISQLRLSIFFYFKTYLPNILQKTSKIENGKKHKIVPNATNSMPEWFLRRF